ncbi:MAG: hypothetical protein KAY22_18560 [Rhizorhabdus sp.]|uniref:hypothetical protein n=1 Tax=Rhizorhabdus sp. TaxID=1968843 RepID=UPI001B45397F|nr:hypothetical protein [Rhizorhabdus sp.]MBP8234302.1 hypothetical protein [Rhizorhabdus sp.]
MAAESDEDRNGTRLEAEGVRDAARRQRWSVSDDPRIEPSQKGLPGRAEAVLAGADLPFAVLGPRTVEVPGNTLQSRGQPRSELNHQLSGQSNRDLLGVRGSGIANHAAEPGAPVKIFRIPAARAGGVRLSGPS